MAGGFTIKTENVEKFKKFILKKFERMSNSKMNTKPLYLDSIIAPSALNLQVYDKVNTSNRMKIDKMINSRKADFLKISNAVFGMINKSRR